MVVRYMTYSNRDEGFNYSNHQPASQPAIYSCTLLRSFTHSHAEIDEAGAGADVGNKK